MMTDFSDLPIRNGVGEYNLNRFRLVFRTNRDLDLARELVGSFQAYFNGPGATVSREGDQLEFSGKLELAGYNIPTPHADWVNTIYRNMQQGFTVQTLYRNRDTTGDSILYGAIYGAVFAATRSLASATEIATWAVNVDKHHFLAGRRAFRVGPAAIFDVSSRGNNAFVLETAAIERFSMQEYYMMRRTMQPLIEKIWCHLLESYAGLLQLNVLSSDEWPIENTGWRSLGNVHYVTHHFENAAKMRSHPDYRDVIRLYPSIYEDA